MTRYKTPLLATSESRNSNFRSKSVKDSVVTMSPPTGTSGSVAVAPTTSMPSITPHPVSGNSSRL